jgi:hypothetical protein
VTEKLSLRDAVYINGDCGFCSNAVSCTKKPSMELTSEDRKRIDLGEKVRNEALF